MAHMNGKKILNVTMTGLVNIDTEMSDTSENPVQNKVVKGYVDDLGAVVKRNQNKTLDYINYEITTDDTVTIKFARGNLSGNHIIPSMIEGYPVKCINNSAFGEQTNLNSIEIPNGVVTIGNGAFQNCLRLAEITIPNSLLNMGDGAFENCHFLGCIAIPNLVTSIGERTFSRCDNLMSITIPDRVTSIGDNAFEECNMLADVYYMGSKEQWDAINIGANNEALFNANIHYDQAFATKEYVNEKIGDIETALDSIIAIQKELIGVTLISFILQTDFTFNAEEGMTWREWINSKYNTSPFYIISDGSERDGLMGDDGFYFTFSLDDVIEPNKNYIPNSLY